MSTAVAAKKTNFIDRHYHLIRRLHSLSGIVPIGLFLFPHLTTNSSIMWGKALNGAKFADRGIDAAGAGVATFQHEVEFIHGLPSRRCDIDECSLELSLSRPANASSSPTAAR